MKSYVEEKSFNETLKLSNFLKFSGYYFSNVDLEVLQNDNNTVNLIYDIDLTLPTAIIMGSEDRGINPSILKIVEHKAKLPLLGEIESLNVSVACGAFLYETTRQRIKAKS